MVSTVVISIKFLSMQQCLNYLSSLHRLSTSQLRKVGCSLIGSLALFTPCHISYAASSCECEPSISMLNPDALVEEFSHVGYSVKSYT